MDLTFSKRCEQIGEVTLPGWPLCCGAPRKEGPSEDPALFTAASQLKMLHVVLSSLNDSDKKDLTARWAWVARGAVLEPEVPDVVDVVGATVVGERHFVARAAVPGQNARS